jgi:hypothetical protein
MRAIDYVRVSTADQAASAPGLGFWAAGAWLVRQWAEGR